MSTSTTSRAVARPRPLWRDPAALIAALLAVALLGLAAAAFLGPVAAATRFGLPLADAADAHLMQVYAVRTVVLAAVILILLARGHRRALAWIIGVAVMLPITDAALTSAAGAGTGVVIQHVVTAVILAIEALLLARDSR